MADQPKRTRKQPAPAAAAVQPTATPQAADKQAGSREAPERTLGQLSYRVFTWQNGVPWTNNGTEQAIGRMKMHSRRVWGADPD